MKTWFKYKYGFVNIDEGHLYLTSTGNWAEAEETLQHNKKSSRSNKLRRWRVLLYLGIFAFTLLFMILRLLFTSEVKVINWIFLILMPVGIYFLYFYMQREIGPKYKVPLKQLKGFRFLKKDIQFSFINEEGKEEQELLEGVEEKGYDILDELKENLQL